MVLSENKIILSKFYEQWTKTVASECKQEKNNDDV